MPIKSACLHLSPILCIFLIQVEIIIASPGPPCCFLLFQAVGCSSPFRSSLVPVCAPGLFLLKLKSFLLLNLISSGPYSFEDQGNSLLCWPVASLCQSHKGGLLSPPYMLHARFLLCLPSSWPLSLSSLLPEPIQLLFADLVSANVRPDFKLALLSPHNLLINQLHLAAHQREPLQFWQTLYVSQSLLYLAKSF